MQCPWQGPLIGNTGIVQTAWQVATGLFAFEDIYNTIVSLSGNLVHANMPDTTCLNCGKGLKPKHRFCPKCGQSAKVERLQMQVVYKDVKKRVLHAESGILRLMKALALEPGKVALNYVRGQRKRYYNPIKFLLLSAGISVFINESHHAVEDGFTHKPGFGHGLFIGHGKAVWSDFRQAIALPKNDVLLFAPGINQCRRAGCAAADEEFDMAEVSVCILR